MKETNIPNVLLIGNGINRAFNDVSWDSILNKIKSSELSQDQCKLIREIPYPLQAVAYTKDNLKEKLDILANELIMETPSDQESDIIKMLISDKFDAVITSNYTYEIEKALDSNFSCKYKCANKYRKTARRKVQKADEQFGLFKYMSVQFCGREIPVWHFHGEAARPNSMILGHHYYGSLLSRMHTHIASFKAGWEKCKKEGLQYNYDSWLKYLLFANIYIVGFGMDLSELDIWWLLSCRKNSIKSSGGVYWYEPNLEKDEKSRVKKILAETYGVNVITRRINNNYQKYYKETVEEIKNTLQIE